MRGDAARQLQEPSQPSPLRAAVQRDVLEALGVGQHRAHRDRPHVHQPVLRFGGLAGVVDASQALQQLVQLQQLPQHHVLQAGAPGDRRASAKPEPPRQSLMRSPWVPEGSVPRHARVSPQDRLPSKSAPLVAPHRLLWERRSLEGPGRVGPPGWAARRGRSAPRGRAPSGPWGGARRPARRRPRAWARRPDGRRRRRRGRGPPRPSGARPRGPSRAGGGVRALCGQGSRGSSGVGPARPAPGRHGLARGVGHRARALGDARAAHGARRPPPMARDARRPRRASRRPCPRARAPDDGHQGPLGRPARLERGQAGALAPPRDRERAPPGPRLPAPPAAPAPRRRPERRARAPGSGPGRRPPGQALRGAPRRLELPLPRPLGRQRPPLAPAIGVGLPREPGQAILARVSSPPRPGPGPAPRTSTRRPATPAPGRGAARPPHHPAGHHRSWLHRTTGQEPRVRVVAALASETAHTVRALLTEEEPIEIRRWPHGATVVGGRVRGVGRRDPTGSTGGSPRTASTPCWSGPGSCISTLARGVREAAFGGRIEDRT